MTDICEGMDKQNASPHVKRRICPQTDEQCLRIRMCEDARYLIVPCLIYPLPFQQSSPSHPVSLYHWTIDIISLTLQLLTYRGRGHQLILVLSNTDVMYIERTM